MAEVMTRAMATTTELADGTALGAHLELRSAGTGPWHEGEAMHPLAAAALARAGYSDLHHVAYQFKTSDIRRFDLLVALDRRHLQTLRGLGADPDRLVLLRSFAANPGAGVDVPDPYYGDDDVFDECRDMIAASCVALVTALATHWDSLWAA
jgi:protein-tyrosine phosphatase